MTTALLAKQAARWLALACLAGCASQAPRYFTLAQTQPKLADDGRDGVPIVIEIGAVRVPERLNRRLLVVSGSDGAVSLLEYAQWSANFPDELRDALSQDLQHRVHALDVHQLSSSSQLPRYRISVAVDSMDADMDGHASAVINWSVQRLDGNTVRTGQTQSTLEPPPGVRGIVSAYRQIVAATSKDLAAAIGALRCAHRE